MTNTAKHTSHVIAPPGGNHSTATGAAESFCGRCWPSQPVPTTEAAQGILGLTTGWYCNTIRAGFEIAPAAQAEAVRNTKEATIAGLHDPPAVKVEAGVSIWGRTYHRGWGQPALRQVGLPPRSRLVRGAVGRRHEADPTKWDAVIAG